MKQRIVRFLAVLYPLAAIASLALILLSSQELFGLKSGSLSTVPALLLGLPWSIVLMFFSKLTPLASLVVLGVAMTLNAALLASIARGKSGDNAKKQGNP